MRARALLAKVLAVVALASTSAYGSDGASGIAEQLFLEGKSLMKEGRTEEACQKFEASHDADTSATGTLLNLALCNEVRGNTATAWAQFRQVAAESADKRPDRVTAAREHEAALLPLLRYVVVHVPSAARVDGLSLLLDDKRSISAAMWETRLPLDPGRHSLTVTAPGRRSQRLELVVEKAAAAPSTARDLEVQIAPLEASATAAQSPPAAPTEPRPHPSSSARRNAGYVVGGTGVAALGVGAALGIVALGKQSSVSNACPAFTCKDKSTYDTNNSLNESAKDFALVADVTLAAGVLLAAAGGWLIWSGRDRPEGKASALRVDVVPFASGGGVLVGGGFQ